MKEFVVTHLAKQVSTFIKPKLYVHKSLSLDLNLSQFNLFQPLHPVYLRYILIFCSHLCLSFPCSPLLLDFHRKIVFLIGRN